MTATVIPTMLVEDVEPCPRPSILAFDAHPMECDHLWEPHSSETGSAYCSRCGSVARWSNDPRADEVSCGRRGGWAAQAYRPKQHSEEGRATGQREVAT